MDSIDLERSLYFCFLLPLPFVTRIVESWIDVAQVFTSWDPSRFSPSELNFTILSK